jgi:hypothetical protein
MNKELSYIYGGYKDLDLSPPKNILSLPSKSPDFCSEIGAFDSIRVSIGKSGGDYFTRTS